MRHFTISSTTRNRINIICGATILAALFFVSLFVGKYPLSLEKLLAGDSMQLRVFKTLRLSRAGVGVVGGITLGMAGFVYQTIFRNPLASPDIIGVSSGASAGAAAGILFCHGTLAVTLCSFGGALFAVVLALGFAALDRSGKKSTVVLAGIAVHALAQTVLMGLKLVADPERELASIEYWIMGSLKSINSHTIGWNLIICSLCLVFLTLMHRHTMILSADEAEARTLGANVSRLRFVLLIVATIAVSAVVSMTGLISFVGLLAPHCARKLTGDNRLRTLLLSGLIGGCLLTGADILAKCVANTELPVSIFTSLIGAPFLILLVWRGRRTV